MSNTERNLEALGKSKSKMAEGQPNLQNWKIVDHTGQKIGTVYDVLFDTEAKKVRYIITNLNNGELLKQDRLVLVPVGRARYHESENEVVFPNVTRDQLSSLPDFLTVERLTQEDEYSVRNAFRSEGEPATSTGDQNRDSFYDHDDFNEDSFYNRNSTTTRKEAKVNTTQTEDSKKKEDRNEPVSTSKNVKAGGGSDSLLTGTGDQSTSSENNKKRNEDVNVHPDPATRTADGEDRENTQGGKRNNTNAEKKNTGRANGDNDRS